MYFCHIVIQLLNTMNKNTIIMALIFILGMASCHAQTHQPAPPTTDPTDLLNRIDKQHGIHTIEHAEAIGLGTRKYHIVDIDK